MADRKRLTTISLSIGDELLDAVTGTGRTMAVPCTFKDESGARSFNVPVDAGQDFDEGEDGHGPAGR